MYNANSDIKFLYPRFDQTGDAIFYFFVAHALEEKVSSVHFGARNGEVVIVPNKDSCFSFPYSMSDLSASIQRDELPFLGLTISRKNLRLRAQSFP